MNETDKLMLPRAAVPEIDDDVTMLNSLYAANETIDKRGFAKGPGKDMRVKLIRDWIHTKFQFLSDQQNLYCWDGYCYRELPEIKLKKAIEPAIEKSKFMAISEQSLHELYEKLKSASICDDINQKPLIPFLNGYYNYETFEFVESDPVFHFTYCFDYNYEPEKDCPRFKQFLTSIRLTPDQIDLLLTYSALSFTPDLGNQLSLFLIGRGANGKSTFTEILAGLLQKQCTNADFDRIINSDNRFDTACLRDVTLCICSEIESEDASNKNVNKFKRLTTQQTIKIERKGKDPIDVQNKVKYMVDANNLPTIHVSDPYAFFRRVRILYFNYRIPVAERIKNLSKLILQEEAGAVAGYLLSFLPRIHAVLVENPEETQSLWDQGVDETRWFIEHNLVICSDTTTSFKEIYSAYQVYMAAEGLEPIYSNRFSSRLKFLGYDVIHRMEGNFYNAKLI